MEEDFYSIVLYERLVLDTSWNSGYLMECLLVTSLAALDDPQDGRGRCFKGAARDGQDGHSGR